MATITNSFLLLEGDNEDPMQLAAATKKKVRAVQAEKKKAAVPPSRAGGMREAKNETSAGGGHGGGRGYGCAKSGNTSEWHTYGGSRDCYRDSSDRVSDNGIDHIGHIKREGSDRRNEEPQTNEVAQVTTDVSLAEKNLGDNKPYGAEKPEGKESDEVAKLNLGGDKLEEEEFEIPKLKDVDKNDDKPEGEKGVGDDKKEDKEMTLDESSNGKRSPPQLLGMLFEFLYTLCRSPFRVARYFYASPKSVFTAPASGKASGASEVMSTVLQESTTPLHPSRMKKMLRDLSRVIPDPPPVVDSDSLRYDKLHDKGNRVAEFDDLCLRVEEVRRQKADLIKKEDQLRDLCKGCCTVDEYLNCNKWGLNLIKEFEAVEERMLMVARRVQKYLLFELHYLSKK